MVPEDYANLQLVSGRRFSTGTKRLNCSGTIDVLIDSSDSDKQLLHRVHRKGVDLFGIHETTGNLRYLESFVSEELELADVVLSPRGGYLYGANLDSLAILKRDPETLEFTLMDAGYDLNYLHALSISDDGKYLVALENRNVPHTIKVFDLTNPEEPELAGQFVDSGYAVVGFGQCQASILEMEDMLLNFSAIRTILPWNTIPGRTMDREVLK